MTTLVSDRLLQADVPVLPPQTLVVQSAQYGAVALTDLLLQVRDVHIRLKKKEAKLVRLLFEAGGRTVSLVALKQVLGYRPDTNTHTVENHIYRIRTLLRIYGISDLILSAAATPGFNVRPGAVRGYLLPLAQPETLES